MLDTPMLNTFAAYWVLATWCVGAFVVALGLGMLAMKLIQESIRMWTKTYRDYRTALWLYRAIRHYERTGHKPPKGAEPREPKHWLRLMADGLISAAEEEGMVVTIETYPKLFRPLAMGCYEMHADVRESRATYSAAEPAKTGGA